MAADHANQTGTMMAKKPMKQAAAVLAEDKALHRVKVNRVVELAGFTYKPGHDHTVDDTTLQALKAADAVSDVQSAS